MLPFLPAINELNLNYSLEGLLNKWATCFFEVFSISSVVSTHLLLFFCCCFSIVVFFFLLNFLTVPIK